MYKYICHEINKNSKFSFFGKKNFRYNFHRNNIYREKKNPVKILIYTFHHKTLNHPYTENNYTHTIYTKKITLTSHISIHLKTKQKWKNLTTLTVRYLEYNSIYKIENSQQGFMYFCNFMLVVDVFFFFVSPISLMVFA